MATARSGRYMPYLGDKFANSNLIAHPLSGANPVLRVYKRAAKKGALEDGPPFAPTSFFWSASLVT